MRLFRGPWIDKSNAATRKAADVAGGDSGSGSPRHRGDLCVKGFDGIARTASGDNNIRVMDRRRRIEGQHAASKFFAEHGIGNSSEFRTSAPFGQQSDPEKISALLTLVVQISSRGRPAIQAITAASGADRISSERTFVSSTIINRNREN